MKFTTQNNWTISFKRPSTKDHWHDALFMLMIRGILLNPVLTKTEKERLDLRILFALKRDKTRN